VEPPEWGEVRNARGSLTDFLIKAPCGCYVRDVGTDWRDGHHCERHSFADLVEGERRLSHTQDQA